MTLEQKLSDAIRAVIIAAGTTIPDAQIYTDFNSQEETRTLPCVSIKTGQADETGFGSGNYRFTVTVEVMSGADAQDGNNPRDDHSARAVLVFDALLEQALHTQLSAAVSDFTAFNAISRSRGDQETVGRTFVTSMLLSIVCAPSDIS